MKRILAAIAVTVFVIYPSLSFSSYAIHLKDGREFVTDRYWEEGGQIKFKIYGGVIGIHKDLVRDIEMIDEVETTEELPVEKETSAEPETSTAGAKTAKNKKTGDGARKIEAPKQKGAHGEEKANGKEQEKIKGKPVEISEEEKKKEEQEKTAKREEFLEEKHLIIVEKNLTRQAFREAKAKRDKVATKQHYQRLIFLRNKIKELEERVKAEFDGRLPDWWRE